MVFNEADVPQQTQKPDKVFSDQVILSHVNDILAHKEFHATDKMRDFLRFIVNETLAGRSRQLKGFTIATEVYHRGVDFDAAHDPVVRIQAGRLRRAIERYYLTAGVHNPIRIKIPKGAYVPQFTAGPMADTVTATNGARTGEGVDCSWPVVMVRPFHNNTNNSELNYLGNGLASELCSQLGHYLDLRVIMYREGAHVTYEEDTRANFTVGGTIYCDDSSVKILVHLIENATGVQLWSEEFKTSSEHLNLIETQENSARAIAAHIACQRGIILRKLSTQLGSRTTDLTTHEALLKASAYDQSPSIESYMGAFEALQGVIRNGSQCGLVSGRLARLYTDNISLELFDLEQTPIEHTLCLAQEAVRLEPNDRMNRLVMARVRMLIDDLDSALVETEAALMLNPECLQHLDSIGYMLTLLGQWERGITMIRDVIQINPFYQLYVHYGTWLNCFRQQDYQRSLQEIELTLGSWGFWDPLARAATLGQMGRYDEANQAVKDLLTLKPDFPERGKILIGHYVKFADIAEKIAEGLEKAGLNMEQPLSQKIQRPNMRNQAFSEM